MTNVSACSHTFMRGKTSSIRQRLQKGTTDTGNVKFGIVEAEWDWLQKRFKGEADREQKYFCSLLALTHAMCASDHWMYDNECWAVWKSTSVSGAR